MTVNQLRGPVNFLGFVLALGQRHQSLRVVLNTNTANADHTHTQRYIQVDTSQVVLHVAMGKKQFSTRTEVCSFPE